MKIRWMGHSCFLITAKDGTRILTDPYDDTIGYPPLRTEADIVTTSHGHFDHNHIASVSGKFTHLNKPGTFSKGEITITSIAAFHDEAGGSKRGGNLINIFEVDDIVVCHCGDLGHIPNQETIVLMKKADVLMIPVGGTFTLDAQEAARLANTIDAAITIPMHYKDNYLTFKIDGVEKFTAALGITGVAAETGLREIELNKHSLPNQAELRVFKYA